MSIPKASCAVAKSVRQAVSQVDYVSLPEWAGNKPLAATSTIHFFNGQMRTAGTSANWTMQDPITPSDVAAIEIVDLFVPALKGGSDPGYVYVRITINNNTPLEHVNVHGRWFTAIIPTITSTSRVSMKQVCGERVLIRYPERPIRTISKWTLEAFVYNTTTGSFEFYPLTDDLAFANNIAFKAECLHF